MDRKKVDSIGFAAFFDKRENIVKVLFEGMLIDFNTFRKYTPIIKQRRNTLIYLSALQILAALLSMIILVFRRSFIYIIINLVTMFLAFSGIYGSIKLKLVPLIIHCVFTTSITGGFFIYQLLDLFLLTDTSYGQQKRFNDNLILFIFSLPYLFDCFVGLYNYFFLKKIADFNTEQMRDDELLKQEQEMQIQKKYSAEQIDQHMAGVDNKLCVICMDKIRNIVMNPCGHILCCEECAKALFENKRLWVSDVNCPVCKRKCESYLQVYIS